MGAAAIPAAAAGGGGLYSAYQQGQAGKMQAGYYNYLSKTADTNAGLAQARGQAATEAIGAQEFDQERRLNSRTTETVGAQTAALAAGGAGAGSRTAEDIIRDTTTKAGLDDMAIRTNAEYAMKSARFGATMEAMNYASQSGGYQMAGANALSASRAGQVSTMLGAAGSVANSWYMGRMYGSRGGSSGPIYNNGEYQ